MATSWQTPSANACRPRHSPGRRTVRCLRLLFCAAITLSACDSAQQEAIREKAEQALDESIATLTDFSEGDFTAFRLQLRELKAALDAQDFGAAKATADSLDQLFESDIVAETVDLLRVQVANGSEAAARAIDESAAAGILDEAELEYLGEVAEQLAAMNKQEFAQAAGGIVAGSIYIALEHKMNHSGAIPGAIAGAMTQIVIEELF